LRGAAGWRGLRACYGRFSRLASDFRAAAAEIGLFADFRARKRLSGRFWPPGSDFSRFSAAQTSFF